MTRTDNAAYCIPCGDFQLGTKELVGLDLHFTCNVCGTLYVFACLSAPTVVRRKPKPVTASRDKLVIRDFDPTHYSEPTSTKLRYCHHCRKRTTQFALKNDVDHWMATCTVCYTVREIIPDTPRA